jgi:hypothetical protein
LENDMPNNISTQQGQFNDPDVDLWLRDGFGGIDLRDERSLSTEIQEQAAGAAAATTVAQQPTATTEEQPSHVEELTENEEQLTENEDEPTVYEYEDGSTIVIEKVPTGLKAVLDAGSGGGKETFYGHDENELLTQVLTAKLHATKKIRELNRELKIGASKPTAKQSQQAVSVIKSPELTADEKFEFKTKFESDPAAALDEYLQRVTGKSIKQIADDAASGRRAAENYNMDAEATAFIEDHPLYVRTNENFLTIVGFLAKKYLNAEVTDSNSEAVMQALNDRGFFTRDLLSNAYDELVSDGLLELLEEDDGTTEVDDATTTLAGSEESSTKEKPKSQLPRRISRQTRPRATSIAHGLTSKEVISGPSQVESGKVPTVEEIDNMSTQQVNDLMSQITRARIAASRRP